MGRAKHLDSNELFAAKMGSVSGGGNVCGTGGEISLYHTTQSAEDEAALKPDQSYQANHFYRDDIVVRALMGDKLLRQYILVQYDRRKETLTRDGI